MVSTNVGDKVLESTLCGWNGEECGVCLCIGELLEGSILGGAWVGKSAC